LVDRKVLGPSGNSPVGRSALVARLALVGGLAILISACDSRGGKIPYDPAGFGPPDRAELGVEAYDVPLGPLDVLKINVFRVPELTGEYQVDAFGNLDLPLLGKVSVRDHSPDQFAQLLEKRYGDKYLQNPDISVRVSATNRTSVAVEGGVNFPGIYQLPGRTTLLGAIALARGVNASDGNAKRVVIIRKRDGKTQAAAFDLTSIRNGEMADPTVYPGDIIAVNGSNLRSVYRDVLQAVPLLAIFSNL
jgi:polysaccharide export outer membrane protein